jgi:glucose/mannose-6-phosphate isomerase
LPVYFEVSFMQMLSLIEAFPQQLAEAIDIARSSTLHDLKFTPQHVVISGLGGSGIGGSIVAEYVAYEGKIPVHVCKEYHLPAWVNEQSLVILSSYSGDTEETLSTFHQAVERNAQIICISSGGTISKLAQEHGFDLIQIPGGNPPRACLGYSLVQLLGIFEHYGWIENALQSVENARKHMVEKTASYQREAESIAKAIAFSTPVIYTCAGYEGVAIRFR